MAKKSKTANLAPTVEAHDVRSRAKESKRDKDHKSKWDPKWAYNGIPSYKTDSSGTRHPCRRAFLQGCDYPWIRSEKSDIARQTNKEKKRPALEYDSSSTFDSSADEHEIPETSASGVEWGQGPVTGLVTLEKAVEKAVEKYEDEQTKKLVKDEYEFLDATSELNDTMPILDDDEDYELV